MQCIFCLFYHIVGAIHESPVLKHFGVSSGRFVNRPYERELQFQDFQGGFVGDLFLFFVGKVKL